LKLLLFGINDKLANVSEQLLNQNSHFFVVIEEIWKCV